MTVVGSCSEAESVLSLVGYDRGNISTPDSRCVNSSHFEMTVVGSCSNSGYMPLLNGYDRGNINAPDSRCANSSYLGKRAACPSSEAESASSLNGYDRRDINIPNSQCENSSHLRVGFAGPRRTLGGMGSRHFAAASLRRSTTSAAFGRRFLSEFQQSWVKSHSESENPISEACSGLSGRFPPTTANTSSACRRLWNGISPVRT